MKYVVILGDGMADEKIEKLNFKTPLDVANKPNIDALAKNAYMGLCKTVPDGMKAGSDVANLAVLGYNPKTSYTGRSPLEAVSIGIDLKETDVTLRANLVTLSNEQNYADKIMVDYSAGEISTSEAKTLIDYLKLNLDSQLFKLYSGVSYRHCLVVDNGETGANLTPPHDISKKPIKNFLPKGVNAKLYLELMEKSNKLLSVHPINVKRRLEGKNEANSLWFWGEGTKPYLQTFFDRYNLNGGMISAVDLLKGIALLNKMQLIEVEGATGNYKTNFTGKANMAIDYLLNKGLDYVYIHMEAPDECGHQGDLDNKIKSIELIDSLVVAPIVKALNDSNEDYAILITPDHPTPICKMTHTPTPVPFMIYKSNKDYNQNNDKYTEDDASKTNVFIDSGEKLMQIFIKD